MSTVQLEYSPLKSSAFNYHAEKHLENIKHNLMNGFTTNNDCHSNSPKTVKDRSIYGQPKVSLAEKRGASSLNSSIQTTPTWRSLDSLSTPDSGISVHSVCASTSTSTSDLRSRFEANVSDLGTSVETSEDEADTYRRHGRCDSSLSCSQISTGSDVFEPDMVCCEPKRSMVSGKPRTDDRFDHNDNESLSKIFMKNFVQNIFRDCSKISLEEKAIFGEFARSLTGRLWFARYINEQRNENKQVNESTFYSLAQYFALILFECCEADDYTPARILMNMCFTYYVQTSKTIQPKLSQSSSSSPSSSTSSSASSPYASFASSFSPKCSLKALRQNSLRAFFPSRTESSNEPPVIVSEPYYLSNILRDQPIWKSSRFWNAAFFDAIQDERETYFFTKPEANGKQLLERQNSYDDWQFQANVTFGALATFTHNMHAFGLSKCFCLQFLQKQSTIATLTLEQIRLIQDNIDRLYSNK